MQTRSSALRYAMVAAASALVLAGAVVLLVLLDPGDGEVVAPEPGLPQANPGPIREEPEGPEAPAPEGPEITPPADPASASVEVKCLVRGRVTDLEGNPLSDQRVVLALPFGQGDSMPLPAALFALAEQAETRGWPVGLTGSDGAFEITALRPGPGVLLAGPPDFGELHREIRLSAEPVSVELRLEAGLAVAGRVFEKTSGAGVEGVIVNAMQAGGQGRNLRRKTATALDGSFSAGGFKPGEVQLSLGIKGDRGLDLGWDRDVRVKAGARDIRVAVFRIGHLELRAVLSPSGAPLVERLEAVLPSEPEARVLIYNTSGNEYLLRGPAGTHDFLFTFPGLSVQPATARLTLEAGQRLQAGAPLEFREGHTLLCTFETPGHIPPEPEGWWGFVFLETLDPPLCRIRAKAVGYKDLNRGLLRFDGLSKGPHRIVAAAKGFGLLETTRSLSDPEEGLRLQLTVGAPSPRPAGKPFFERRSVMLDFTIPQALTPAEVVSLLAAVSDTALLLDPSVVVEGIEGTSMQMNNLRLLDVVQGLETIWKLDFDQSAGVFRKR